jgi:hypothetical protein
MSSLRPSSAAIDHGDLISGEFMTNAPPPAQAHSAENPGQTLGIVALICAFVFQLLGLILGIVALNQSKKAGMSNGLAVAAIWISAILLAIGIIIGIIVAFAWVDLFFMGRDFGFAP